MGRKILITIILGLIPAVYFSTAPAQEPFGKDLKRFYHDHCVKCHGPDGSAVGANGKKLKGEDFTDQEWRQSTEDEEMVDKILNGIFFGMAMPKFKDLLTREEAQEMVTEILRKSEKGKVIYENSEHPDKLQQ